MIIIVDVYKFISHCLIPLDPCFLVIFMEEIVKSRHFFMVPGHTNMIKLQSSYATNKILKMNYFFSCDKLGEWIKCVGPIYSGK